MDLGDPYICTFMQPSSEPTPRTPREASRRREALDHLLDASLFAALADPTRLRLLACIAKCRRACSVSEVASCCAVDLSVVSRHLRSLEMAGVLDSEREGRVVRYRLCARELAARLRVLAEAIESKAPRSGDAPSDDDGICGEGNCHACC